ncbi:MAG: acetolactate synthase isozyme 1 small subunit [Spirochaetes bacterium]|nr:acetolactate synthase isozyme 1 small subunit [Spirochaetota bacterium]
MNNKIIKLKVKNHPGAMPHVVSLFLRNAINPDVLLYEQDRNKKSSNIYFVMNNNLNTEQILKQLTKLQDIINISVCDDFIDNSFSDFLNHKH